MASADFETALDQTSEIELTATGRVSGRRTSRPVWFVREDDRLFLLPVTGSATQWYKNVLATPAIRLAARGTDYDTTATPVTDRGQLAHVIDDFRAKYGARDVAAYYSNPDVAVEISLR
jgi:deazaflavin-dependent oxidoreductase (nitroreductase family)